MHKRRIKGSGRAYLPPLKGAGRAYLPPLKGAGKRKKNSKKRFRIKRGKFLPLIAAALPGIASALLPTIGKALLGGAISGGIAMGINKLAK